LTALSSATQVSQPNREEGSDEISVRPDAQFSSGAASAGPLLVTSHRRSGTHLLIDLLRNNFETRFTGWLSLDRVLTSAPGRPFRASERRELSTKSATILKSHARGDGREFFDPTELRYPSAELFEIFDTTPSVYVIRDPADALDSLFRYWSAQGMTDGVDFETFLKRPNPGCTGDSSLTSQLNVVDYWIRHAVEGVARCDRVVTFDDIVADGGIRALAKVADLLGLEPVAEPRPVYVRATRLESRLPTRLRSFAVKTRAKRAGILLSSVQHSAGRKRAGVTADQRERIHAALPAELKNFFNG